jgi:hypothetical protein
MELGFQLKSAKLCMTVFEIQLTPHPLWNYVKLEGVHKRWLKGFNWRRKMACWNAQIGQGLVFRFSKGRRLSTIGTGSLFCEPDLCCFFSLKILLLFAFQYVWKFVVKCPTVPDCCTWLQLGKMLWALNCTQGWMSYEYDVKDPAFCSRLQFLRKPSLPGAWRTRWHSAKSKVNGVLLHMSRWCTSVANFPAFIVVNCI